MSTKPGVTSSPLASISSPALPDSFPTATIRPSFTATSASRKAAPVPSATLPPRTVRSNVFAMFAAPDLPKSTARFPGSAPSDGRIPSSPASIRIGVGPRAAAVEGHDAQDEAQVVPPAAVGKGVDAHVEEQTGNQREQRNV